ncbi:MAG: DsbA family protein [Pseudomonadota bacterium]
MTKRLPHVIATALAAIALSAAPLAAQDVSTLSDAERDAFRAEVRAYLLEHPEVLMEALTILEEREAIAAAERDLQLVALYADALFDSPNDVVLGNPDGDITIVEFIDYRCGFCRRAAPELEALLAADGNIRVVIKEFPILGEQSTLAAQFALAARLVGGDEAYADMHYALISMRADMTEPNLVRLANTLGYDGEAILARIADPRIETVISANYELARAMEISGTPTFVMGGQLVRGFLPAEQMAEIIEQERASLD